MDKFRNHILEGGINVSDHSTTERLNENDILDIFKETGALLQGHFLLTSGKHSARYMQCAQVLQYPRKAAVLGKDLAGKFEGMEIETVIGPAMGGIVVAHEVGRNLGVKAIFTERQNGEMALRRGFKLEPGEKVLVVEDVITTGGSVKEVINIVKEAGAVPVGVGVLVDRSGGKADFDGLLLHSLIQMNIEAYEPDDCPLCKQGIPWEKPGSRGIK
ncbi:Orotate phosphoribosyltransferase [Dehalobacter sp. UNSWDHB]|jgi:orotate phosphoribosyltransferase, Thermus family|uniref:orotate phosphoribosyltransferase n=1 Tax=unclassified Dehalobacter TaxID=2635733 RepID=UPI00028A7A3C|nr:MULTISPECIES: orotate phosphoribosyltransferase [unclassified Dehalobacter]AFV02473.1 Orotate phosphoribosyltransferase [Dehalobacter sp. DCA]AFV05463.1 Orotate phosphoribosyltransferase [Dehalobacter sp. CF]EQB22321.1 Orotate phosphoribosyltransferase [Dehalobacter sp. UNSWDHB]